jgi:hypothetical protein
MLRRRHIDTDPGRSRLRATPAAAARPFRAVGWVVRERVLWPIEDLLPSFGERVKWPLQRLGWGFERRLIWPVRERVSSWSHPRRVAGVSALVAVAIGAAAFGVLMSSQEDPASDEQVAAVAPVTLADAQAAQVEQSGKPTLQGAAPVFGVKESVEVASAESGDKGEAASEADALAALAGSEAEPSEALDTEATAAASSEKPVPAGPEAMKVARHFANAFVFYEVGQRPEQAKAVFGETATPQLAGALSKRPPRLPANAKVPRAKVLNLVPGLRHAKAYTVSVSLLRVGVTSELRLQMKELDGAWVITDVRG